MRKKKKNKKDDGMSTTMMVDVLFILLIFFILISKIKTDSLKVKAQTVKTASENYFSDNQRTCCLPQKNHVSNRAHVVFC